MRPQSAPANQIRAGELMQHMVPVAAPVAHPHKMALSPAAMFNERYIMKVNRRKFLSGAALASAAAGTAACCGMTKTSQSPRQSPWTILSHAPPPNSWKPCAPLPTKTGHAVRSGRPACGPGTVGGARCWRPAWCCGEGMALAGGGAGPARSLEPHLLPTAPGRAQYSRLGPAGPVLQGGQCPQATAREQVRNADASPP